MKPLTSMTASALSALLQAKEISSVELTNAFLQQIESRDCEIGAYLTVCAASALQTAASIDNRRVNGEKLPALSGIPMAIKDNICTRGIRTTCASKMLSDYVPPYSATVYSRLMQNGAVLLGKLNMDEFAMGGSTENSAYHTTRNPHNTAYVPGGSSGGSAAAVAAKEAVYTLGSDTGGSVRLPAAFCGTVGLRPTYGRVSRYGLVAYACSLDQVGIVTKDVRDNALVLQTIAGYDANDFTSSSAENPDYTAVLGREISGLRIGVPKDVFSQTVQSDVKQAVICALEKLESMGAELVELPYAIPKSALQAYYILALAEASCNLARYDGVRYGYRAETAEDLQSMYRLTRSEGFGSEVKRRILVGTYLLGESQRAAYYDKVLQVRRHVGLFFDKSFAMCDLILTPTSPTAAYRIGEQRDDLAVKFGMDCYTVPASLAGVPALSVPCGITTEGLPIGMQLTAPAFCESLLYRVAYAYEREVGNGTV